MIVPPSSLDLRRPRRRSSRPRCSCATACRPTRRACRRRRRARRVRTCTGVAVEAVHRAELPAEDAGVEALRPLLVVGRDLDVVVLAVGPWGVLPVLGRRCRAARCISALRMPSDSMSRRGKRGSAAVRRPGSPAWAPQRSSSRSGGPPLPSAPYGYGVAELGEDARRGRRAGTAPRRGAISRQASTRSPSTPARRARRRLVAGLRGLASSHGFSASTNRFASPTNSQSAASASWSRQPSSRRRTLGSVSPSRRRAATPRRSRRRPLAAEVAVRHRHRPVDEVAEVVREIRVVAPDEAVPADLGVAGRTAPRGATT